MSLNRTHLRLLSERLIESIKKDHNQAFTKIIQWMDKTLLSFYAAHKTNKSNSDYEALLQAQKALHGDHSKTNNKYHRIQLAMRLLAELEEKNKALLQSCLFKSFLTTFPETAEDVGRISNATEEVTLAELSDELSNVFVSGIFEHLHVAFTRHDAQNMTTTLAVKSANTINSALENKLDGVILNGMIVLESLKHSSLSSKEKESLAQQFKAAINTAIPLLAKRQKKNKTVAAPVDTALRPPQTSAARMEPIEPPALSSAVHENTTEEQIIESIQGHFNLYVIEQLSCLNRKHGLTVDSEELYKMAARTCTEIIDQYERNSKFNSLKKSAGTISDVISFEETPREVADRAKALLKSIEQYHQAGAFDSAFGIANPAFELQSKAEREANVQSKIFREECTRLFTERAQDRVKRKALAKLSAYNDNASGVVNQSSERFITQANPTRDDSLDQKFFQVQRLMVAINGMTMAQPHAFIPFLSACNLSLYGDRLANIGYQPAMPFPSMEITQSSSKYKDTVLKTIYYVKKMLCTHGDIARALLGNDESANQHLYYELNLSTNFTIQETAIEQFSLTTHRFPRSLINYFLGNAEAQKDRMIALNQLTQALVGCKTPTHYIEFLMKALSMLSTLNSPLTTRVLWDSRLKDTIRTMMNAVLKQHILSNDTIKLTFDADHLDLVERIFKAARLTDSDSYKLLTEKMVEEQNKTLRSPELSPLKRSSSENSLDAAKPNQQEADEKDKTEKQERVKAFRTALLQKLESNMLADMVISTKRFQINSRDFGIAGSHLGFLLSKLPTPGADLLAGAVVNIANNVDNAGQVKEAAAIAARAAEHGGFQLWWNEVALYAVDELCVMFANQLGDMHCNDDAEKLADVCFRRMYDALKFGIIGKEHKKPDPKNIPTYLVSAVFLNGHTPLIKHHYKRKGDNAWLPKTTIEGLLENVGFVCLPEQPTQPVPETTAQVQSTLSKVAYLAPRSLVVNANNVSKLSKYGMCPTSARLAEQLKREEVVYNGDQPELRYLKNMTALFKQPVQVKNEQMPQIAFINQYLKAN